MSYYIYDSSGYVGDLASNNGLNELKSAIGNDKPFSDLWDDGNVEIGDDFLKAVSSLPDSDKTVKNFKSLVKKCKDIVIITDGIFDVSEPKSKSYTQEQKQDIWNRFAQKTLKQEDAFKRVFGRVFDEQKKLSIDAFEKTGQLPTELQDEQTARRFEPVIEMVYSSGFEDALPKQADLLDEHALEWIATRSLLLAKSINATTLEALRKELRLGFAAGESIQQLTKRLEGYFDTAKKWQAERIARTEVITAANRGANDRYQAAGINKVEWLTSRDGRVCPECDPLDGQVFPIDEGQRPALHPNCRCQILPIIEG